MLKLKAGVRVQVLENNPKYTIVGLSDRIDNVHNIVIFPDGRISVSDWIGWDCLYLSLEGLYELIKAGKVVNIDE